MQKIFAIDGPRGLFETVYHRFREYCGDEEKADEDAIAIITMVNHLREWIAPGYQKDSKTGWPVAVTSEKKVSREVYEHPSFSVVRDVCNGVKHHDRLRRATETKFENEHRMLRRSRCRLPSHGAGARAKRWLSCPSARS